MEVNKKIYKDFKIFLNKNLQKNINKNYIKEGFKPPLFYHCV